jgi:hypothetical protein
LVYWMARSICNTKQDNHMHFIPLLRLTLPVTMLLGNRYYCIQISQAKQTGVWHWQALSLYRITWSCFSLQAVAPISWWHFIHYFNKPWIPSLAQRPEGGWFSCFCLVSPLAGRIEPFWHGVYESRTQLNDILDPGFLNSDVSKWRSN